MEYMFWLEIKKKQYFLYFIAINEKSNLFSLYVKQVLTCTIGYNNIRKLDPQLTTIASTASDNNPDNAKRPEKLIESNVERRVESVVGGVQLEKVVPTKHTPSHGQHCQDPDTRVHCLETLTNQYFLTSFQSLQEKSRLRNL